MRRRTGGDLQKENVEMIYRQGVNEVAQFSLQAHQVSAWPWLRSPR
jgi:hypothetical protein